MKVNKTVWKSREGHVPLVSWEIGSQKMTINAYEINAAQGEELISALHEVVRLMTQSLTSLQAALPAQQPE